MSLCDTMWSSLKRSSIERLEDLDLLPGDLRAPQPADQLFALAAEHAAGDDFDPAVLRLFGQRPSECRWQLAACRQIAASRSSSHARD